METSPEGEGGKEKAAVRDYLNALGVVLRPYGEVEIYLKGVAKELSAGVRFDIIPHFGYLFSDLTQTSIDRKHYFCRRRRI